MRRPLLAAAVLVTATANAVLLRLYLDATRYAARLNADLAVERRQPRAFPQSVLCMVPPPDAFAPTVFPLPMLDPALVGRGDDARL